MACSSAEPMPQTVEAYKKLAQRDLELIEEQRDEIGKLKAKINNLEQKLRSRRGTNWVSLDKKKPGLADYDYYAVLITGGRILVDVWDIVNGRFALYGDLVEYWASLPDVIEVGYESG